MENNKPFEAECILANVVQSCSGPYHTGSHPRPGAYELLWTFERKYPEDPLCPRTQVHRGRQTKNPVNLNQVPITSQTDQRTHLPVLDSIL